MSSSRSIPTVDRISDLPESILSHILSFLPIKFAATTSLLSKRWKPVWLSLFILNFDDKAFNDFNTFRKFVYSILFSSRDKKTSIESFTLKLGNSSHFKQREYNRIFKFVMQRGVKNLNFDMFHKYRSIKLPPSMLSCKTLQVLRLENIKMWDFDKVDFPCLKTLHLDIVDFKSHKYFAKFLCGCPILEDLNAKIVCSECLKVSPNSTIAPECLSSQLKTFRIDCYTGTEFDFNFVKYIMQHSKVLETMRIKSVGIEKKQMLMKLSSCTMSSATCLLLFD